MIRLAKPRALAAVLAIAAGAAPFAANATTPFLLPSMFSTQADHVLVQAAQALEAYFVGAIPLRGGKYALIGPDGAAGDPGKVVDFKDITIIEPALPVVGTYRLTTGQWTTRTTRMVKIDGAWKAVRPPQPPGREQGGRGPGGPGGEGAPRPAPRPNPRFVEEADIPAGAESVTTHAYLTAEVYISRGAPNDTAMKPSGKGLELTPSKNPTDLFDGDAPSFRLTLDGKPAPGANVVLHAAGNNYTDKVIFAEGETDANGVYKRAFPPGIYNMQVTYPAPAPQNPAAPPVIDSYVYTLTFEVSR